LKTKCVDSRVNMHILASTSAPFTLTTVQVPNLALSHTKRITVQSRGCGRRKVPEAETETEAVSIKETEGRGNGSRDGINTVGGGNVCRGGIRDSKRHRGR
jgi:hypothetical protein